PELPGDWFQTHDISIIQPYGGLPADATAAEVEGAGLAIAAALVSMLGGHMVRIDVALSGGLKPTGEPQAIPGLKQMRKVAERTWTKRLIVAGEAPNDPQGAP